MRKLKIALIIATLDRAGAEKQLVLLAQRLDRQRFEPRVFALTRGGPYESELAAAGVPVTVLGKVFKYDFRVIWKLRDLLRDWGADVAYTWMFTANAFGRAAAIRAGVPVIVAGEQDTGAKPALHHAIDRYLSRRSDAIVANSEGVREYGLKHGWPTDKIRLIHAGIDLAEIDQRPTLLAPLPEVPAGHSLVLTACRLTPQKGILHLMWAIGLLRHAEAKVHLWIAGDGPERARLEWEVDRMKVEGYVTFLGQRQDVPAVLQRADMFILPSFHEGMSNAVLEAMLAGKPVIVSDVAGMRELVGGGRYGRIVEPGYPKSIAAGIFQMMKYAEESARMAREGQAHVRQAFSADRFVQAHEELFEELAKAKGVAI
jgi:glycosyltransferase involved in cell wall biosynthesis